MSKKVRINLQTIIITLILVFSLCACGKDKNEQAVQEPVETPSETTKEEEPEPEPEIKTKTIKRIAKEENTSGYSYEYKYDEQGNLIAKVDARGNAFYKYEYNDQNLLLREMKLDNYFEQPYFYDDMDMSYDKIIGEAEFDVSDDQMKMIEEGYTRYTEYEYDEKGNKISEIDYGIDAYGFFFPLTYEVINSHIFEYNGDGTLAKIGWCAREPKEPVWDYILIYDDNGNNIGLQIAASDDGEISREIEYELDDKGNILSGYDLEDFRDITYTYDNDGNILTKTSEQYDFYEDFADEKAFSYYDLDTYEYEDGLLISHRYRMIPIGEVDPDYEFYVKDETVTYEYEEIEVEISEEEALALESMSSEEEAKEEETKEIPETESSKKNVDDKLYELYSCININEKPWFDWKYDDNLIGAFPELKDTDLGKDAFDDLKVSKEGTHEGCPVWYYERTELGNEKSLYIYSQSDDMDTVSTRISISTYQIMTEAEYNPKYESAAYANGFQKLMIDNGLESAEDVAGYVGVDVEKLKEQKEISFESPEFGTMKVKYDDDNPKFVAIKFVELSEYPNISSFDVYNISYGSPKINLTISQRQ